MSPYACFDWETILKEVGACYARGGLLKVGTATGAGVWGTEPLQSLKRRGLLNPTSNCYEPSLIMVIYKWNKICTGMLVRNLHTFIRMPNLWMIDTLENFSYGCKRKWFLIDYPCATLAQAKPQHLLYSLAAM